MAHEFLTVGETAINLSHVCHVVFDATGGATLYTSHGTLELTGEDAEVVAKAVGRHEKKAKPEGKAK